MALAGDTAPARTCGSIRARPRAFVLHRRDLRDRRARSRRQPWRRRAVRQPDRHVPRAIGAGVRHFARARADPRRDGRARDVPAGLGAAPADVMVTIWNLDARSPMRWARSRVAASAGFASRCIPSADKIGKQFKYASSRAASRSSPWSATTNCAQGRGHAQEPGNRRAAGRSPTMLMSRLRVEARERP